MAADLPARRMQLLLKTSVIFVGRILTAISSDAKGIAGEAGAAGILMRLTLLALSHTMPQVVSLCFLDA